VRKKDDVKKDLCSVLWVEIKNKENKTVRGHKGKWGTQRGKGNEREKREKEIPNRENRWGSFVFDRQYHIRKKERSGLVSGGERPCAS